MADAKARVPPHIPYVKLRSHGLEVSIQGLNCLGMSAFYGLPKPESDMIALIRHAVSSGITFLDTSDVYGPFTVEILQSKILISCVVVAMVKKDLLSPRLIDLVVLRHVALIAGAIFNRASSLGWKWKSRSNFIKLDDAQREKVEPLLISKSCTEETLLYVSHLR